MGKLGILMPSVSCWGVSRPLLPVHALTCAGLPLGRAALAPPTPRGAAEPGHSSPEGRYRLGEICHRGKSVTEPWPGLPREGSGAGFPEEHLAQLLPLPEAAGCGLGAQLGSPKALPSPRTIPRAHTSHLTPRCVFQLHERPSPGTSPVSPGTELP